MEIKISYVGTLNGVSGIWCGFCPEGVEVTEERQVQEQETTKPLSMQSGRCRNCQDRDGRRDRRGDKNRLGDFIQVLLLDEMHRRRCRHRRCRRFW